MLVIGEFYRRLCLIETVKLDLILEDDWLDYTEKYIKTDCFAVNIIPLRDHPHTDIENGQKEIHYHIDSRFASTLHGFSRLRINLPLKSNERLEYRDVECIGNEERWSTDVNFIRNSKLKHKCIHKGKCPHRGYDLSSTLPTLNQKTNEWEIICPLHSLRFDANTKELINQGG